MFDFILYNLTAHEGIDINNIGLYRDDGLLITRNSTKVMTERIRKLIHWELKSLDFKVTTITNIKQVDFLDVTLDLTNNSFKPYAKPNSNPIYIHPNSNHPPSVIKHIPTSIEYRINTNSSSSEIFHNHSRIL